MSRNKKRNLIFLCLACIIISTIFTFNLSNSRYMGEIKAEDEVLAVPIITLSNNTYSYSIENMLPGDANEYTFQVSNVDGEQANEILLTYYFKINMETIVPLEVEMYEILEDGTEEKITITNNVTEEFQMDVVAEEADKITKDYKLKIIWDESQNSYEYAGQTINMNITLEAIQVTNEN